MADVTAQDVQMVKTSEIAHSLYQAMSRGSCRVAENGEAGPMTVWLMHNDAAVKPLLERVMPGVSFAKWQPKCIEVRVTKTEETAKAIEAILSNLPLEVSKVSAKELKNVGKLSRIPDRSFREARDQALSRVPWQLDGRSFVRVFLQSTSSPTRTEKVLLPCPSVGAAGHPQSRKNTHHDDNKNSRDAPPRS